MSASDFDICVVGGAGHVGAPFSTVLAARGFKTLIYDVNQTAIDAIAMHRVAATQIAFTRKNPRSAGGVYTYDLLVVDADGYNLRRVGGASGQIYSPDWSPDGRRLLYAVVGGHFVVSFALPVWLGGLSFDRRDARAALVLWLLGLACWAALHFASPRPEKPSSRGRRHQPKPGN